MLFLEVTCIINLCHCRKESHRLWNWSVNCVLQNAKFSNSCFWRLMVFMFLFLYRNDTGFQSKSTAVVSASGSSERSWLSLDAFYCLKRFQDRWFVTCSCPCCIYFSKSVMVICWFCTLIVILYLVLTELLWFLHYRNLSTSALMERMPSKWPRPVWHAPWKNYRVQTSSLF